MKKLIIIIVYSFLFTDSFCQTITQKLENEFKQFESDEQVKHAISSLYVIDAATGKIVFDKNSQIGLAPASTQKIITAATAFELLGKDYRYKTEFWWMRPNQNNSDFELMLVKPTGDPTLGSSRYHSAEAKYVFTVLTNSFIKAGIKSTKLIYSVYAGDFNYQYIPDGWVWQDIGNYYGAGSYPFNWKENQSDIILSSSSTPGDLTFVKSVDSSVGTGLINNTVIAGTKNSGDNAYYYFHYGNQYLSYSPLINGTIPPGEKNFKISVAVADPFNYFTNELRSKGLIKKEYSGIGMSGFLRHIKLEPKYKLVYTHYSPPLDSIIYWFLKKSINLYGEALVKTLAYEKKRYGATDTGVNIVKDFWKQKGIDPLELNLYDGSGLSPLNRVTTHAQVEVLKYAKNQTWFNYFYDALPEFNGMKMKSGTISDVKGFCGYQKAKDGKEYIFSFLVNNYNGMSLSLVNKMYKVLDILK